MCGMVGKANVKGLWGYAQIEHSLFPWTPGSKSVKNEENHQLNRLHRISSRSSKEGRDLCFVTGVASAHPGPSNHPTDGASRSLLLHERAENDLPPK
jgi:hypothetical protein